MSQIKRKSRVLLITSLFLAFSSSLSAAVKKHPDSVIVLKSVSERYKQLKNWQAKIIQKTESAGLGIPSTDLGSFAFIYPNTFKYQLEASDFFYTGSTAKYAQYPKGKGQKAYVKNFSDTSKSQLSRYLIFLSGVDISNKKKFAKFEKEFDYSGHKAGNKLRLDLYPKEARDIEKISFEFENEIIAPQLITLYYSTGNTTFITVQKWAKVNPTNLDALKMEILNPKFPEGSIETNM